VVVAVPPVVERLLLLPPPQPLPLSLPVEAVCCDVLPLSPISTQRAICFTEVQQPTAHVPRLIDSLSLTLSRPPLFSCSFAGFFMLPFLWLVNLIYHRNWLSNDRAPDVMKQRTHRTALHCTAHPPARYGVRRRHLACSPSALATVRSDIRWSGYGFAAFVVVWAVWLVVFYLQYESGAEWPRALLIFSSQNNQW
jgi:hypothetical protein